MAAPWWARLLAATAKRLFGGRRHDVENHEIYITNADGKQQTRLTNNYPFMDGDPSWKP